MAAETRAGNRPMPGLRLHLLKDSVRRASFVLAPAVVIVLLNAAAHAVEMKGFDTGQALWWAFVIMVIGLIYAQLQYTSYPLLRALPISRRTLGRFVWAQHVAVGPAVFVLSAAVGVAVVAVATVGKAVMASAADPAGLTAAAMAVAAAVALPAAMLLILNRTPLAAPWHVQMLFYVPAWAFLVLRFGMDRRDSLPLSGGEAWAVLAAFAALMALSYLRAPHLMMGQPAMRAPAKAGTGTAPPRVRLGQLHPLWRMALFDPLQFWPVPVGFFFITFMEANDSAIAFPVFLSFFVMIAAGHAGRMVLERARLMRALPATARQLAAGTVGFFAVASAYVGILAIVLDVALLPQVLPAALFACWALAASLGAFVPVLLVRNATRPAVAVLAAMVLMGVVVISVGTEWAAKPALLPLLCAALPACLILAARLLSAALQNDDVFQYRKPPLQAMMER